MSDEAITPSDPGPRSGPVPPKPTPLRSLTASATRITQEKLKQRRGFGGESWQEDAWEMYDLVGEQRFLASTLANRMSQAHFYIGKIDPDAETPVPITDVVEETESTADDVIADAMQPILDAVGGSASGRAQLIARLGVNLFVSGDGWLVGIPPEMLREDRLPSDPPPVLDDVAIEDLDWRMLSISEVSSEKSGDVTLRMGEGTDEVLTVNPDDLYLIRVWRPHPRRSWQADSPTRSSLPVLRELVGLTMHISAQVDSRLAGAGVFIVPQSAQRAMRTSLGLAEDDERDPFTEALMEAMLTPISDRSSASALVPLVVTVPDEVTDKFNLITFSTPLDTEAKTLRDEAIRRLALGEDAPPELLLGVGGMNHWGAWLVREDVVTTHIEPPLALICDALTTQYLWPVLRSMGYADEQVEQFVIWYDVSHMVMRPDRAADAQTLFDKGVLSSKTLRESNGFDESDAPEVIDDPTTVDPAIEAALSLVSRNPGLFTSPGLANIVEQIRAVMTGQPGPDMTEPAEPSDEEPTPADVAEDEEAPTDEPGTPAPAPPPAIAASGYAEGGWLPPYVPGYQPPYVPDRRPLQVANPRRKTSDRV